MFDITIILAILIFALLIIVHEAGHMIAAKLCGVKVLEFAIGLGPVLFKKRIGETDFAIRALPFGGQCAMEGEDEDSDDERAFNNAAGWKRIIICVAGVAMNFVLGLMIILCLYMPAKAFVTPQIDSFLEHFTGGGESGLREGDIILKVDGYKVYQPGDITIGFERGKNAPYYDVEVKRDGKRIKLDDVKIELKEYIEDGQSTYLYGFMLSAKDATLGSKISQSLKTSLNFVRLVYMGLGDMISGRVSLDEMSGPVGITAVLSDTAKKSMTTFWYLSALIAINLAVMNMLPIPALDGGRIVFILFEIITGKKTNKRIEGIIHVIVLLALLGLMVLVTFNDIWKLVR
ncbi:MAG: site-2 protease family protein [Clostridiales bacterium]|nr:site-2 protease family protein [Clostridiales bacterium]